MKLLHHILRGSTLATALFIFQACYGMPQDYNQSLQYETTVKVVDANGNTLEGVKVSLRNATMTDFTEQTATGSDGMAVIDAAVPMESPALELRFEADGFEAKDLTLEDVNAAEVTIQLDRQAK